MVRSNVALLAAAGAENCCLALPSIAPPRKPLGRCAGLQMHGVRRQERATGEGAGEGYGGHLRTAMSGAGCGYTRRGRRERRGRRWASNNEWSEIRKR
jgi:hypothetical protein